MTGEHRNVQTIEDVKARLEQIRWVAHEGDYEKAHGMEDDLVSEVLFVIANQAGVSGGRWAQEMASTARQTYRIEFARYMA